jgi:glycosyltransferase involved in cell wall biosynthesis
MFNLSYIVTTRNKLPYLQNTMRELLKNKKGDEEIIVADGASTDGTKEYLEELFSAGKINAYLSEPDVSESHGFNKCMLMANGVLIKLITDDDAIYYPAVESCKKFMIEHPEIDLLGTNGGFLKQNTEDAPRIFDYSNEQKHWMQNHTPFSACGLGILLRRKSIPLVGLLDPAFRRNDAEFFLRATAGKANVAWYTGYAFVNISNQKSTSIVHSKQIESETKRLSKFYLDKNPDSFLFKKLKVLKNKVLYGKRLFTRSNVSTSDFSSLLLSSINWLEKTNGKTSHEFIWKK